MQPSTCETCGDPFPKRKAEPWVGFYRGRMPAKRFCSETCRKRAERARARQRQKENRNA